MGQEMEILETRMIGYAKVDSLTMQNRNIVPFLSLDIQMPGRGIKSLASTRKIATLKFLL
jgi:hypothetical protein